MAKDILAVYDPCQVYLERFVSLASEHGSLGCKAQGYTDLRILAGELQDNKIDAVLLALDENMKAAFRENDGLMAEIQRFDGVIVFMGRQHGSSEWKKYLTEAGYEGEIRYINRYQSALEILRTVRLYILERKQEDPAADPDLPLHLAGMYSPVDKSTHPQTAAAILKGQGKVLYINLEQFSGLSAVLKEGSSSLSDILYCYRASPGKLTEMLYRTAGQGYGMDILTAPEDLADLEELSEREWPEFLRAVTRAGDYQYIFLDMSVFEWKLVDMILTYGNLYIPALPYDPAKTFRSVLIRKPGSAREGPAGQAVKMEEFRNYFISRGLEEQLMNIREVQIETD